MKRLTERDTNGTAMAACCGENCKHNFCCENGGFAECGDMDDIIDRLAAYEDTGLEPEEIAKIRADVENGYLKSTAWRYGISLVRLRELAQADRERRCFVFRFGFGETVYRIWVHPSGEPAFVTENRMDILNDLLNAETWDNAYKTREDAEAALRREQDE